jgi:sulfur-oxidizing protein SoxZ
VRNTRIRVPETAAAGETVEIRAMVMHPMDTGFSYNSQGELIPVDIITDFTCHYLGQEVVRITLAPGLSANPYFAFRMRAIKSGPIEFKWVDQHGDVTTASRELKVT